MKKMENFLDESGKIVKWPAKSAMQKEILKYMSEKFEQDRVYTQAEVNGIIESWHSFEDLFLLRRGMIESGFMHRERDGSKYWLTATPDYK